MERKAVCKADGVVTLLLLLWVLVLIDRKDSHCGVLPHLLEEIESTYHNCWNDALFDKALSTVWDCYETTWIQIALRIMLPMQKNCKYMATVRLWSFTSGWHIMHFLCALAHKVNLEGITIICSNILATQYLCYTSFCSRASIRFRTTQVFQFKVSV